MHGPLIPFYLLLSQVALLQVPLAPFAEPQLAPQLGFWALVPFPICPYKPLSLPGSLA